MNKKFQPRKIIKIVCPTCKEPMITIYPWSSILIEGQEGKPIPRCGRCLNKGLSLRP